MKILLINPPETGTKENLTIVGLPLGILYIAAVLEKKEKHVEIFDSITASNKLLIRNLSDNMVHVGASWKRIAEKIKEMQPDIVGISNQFSSQIENAIRVSGIAKKISKKIVTVVGGPHASSRPEDFLQHKSIDFVIRGEGEYAFLELVEAIEKRRNKRKELSKIKNLAFAKGKKLIINPIEHIVELDKLPLPAYHLINMENYFKIMEEGRGRILVDVLSKRQVSIITSRGCPYNCVFCSIYCHMGRRWRAHSADYVIRHIKHVVEKYGVEHISFEDDNLIIDTERFSKILDRIKKDNIKITWDTPNGIRADRLTPELVKKMKETGCTSLKIGIESGDQHVLDSIVGKNLNLQKVVEAAKLCKEFKIPLTGFFIIGLPGEKKSNIARTLNFAYILKKKYFVNPIVTIAMPLIGTKLYDISKEKGYLKEGQNPTEFVGTINKIIETEDFDINYLRKARNKFYKRIILLQIFEMFRNTSSFPHYAKLLGNPRRGMRILMNLIKYVR